jgi:hypothetical protein
MTHSHHALLRPTLMNHTVVHEEIQHAVDRDAKGDPPQWPEPVGCEEQRNGNRGENKGMVIVFYQAANHSMKTTARTTSMTGMR